MGIKSYVLYTKKDDGKLNPMLKIANFDPFSPTLIRLGTGTISFVAEITDIAFELSMKLPTSQHLTM